MASLDEQYLTRIPEFSKLYTVFAAQMNYLQSEYASLVVKGQFGSETTNLFKFLEKNNNQFKGETLDNLRAAAEISAAKTRVHGDQEGFNNRRFNYGKRGSWSNRFNYRGSGRGYYRPPQDTNIPTNRNNSE